MTGSARRGRSKTSAAGRRRMRDEHLRHGDGADQGFTLVELMIAMTITAVIITLSTTIISSYFNNGAQINSAYQGFDEVIPSTTSLQQYLITMVEPATPTVSGGAFTPIPPFSYNSSTGYQLSPNSATFTSNTGDPSGPGLVQISTTANAAPRGGNPQTYTLMATLTPADPGTCPDVSSGTKCTWGVTTKPTRIVTINDLINGSTTATTPVLQFATNTSGGIVSPYSTTAGSAWQTAFGPGSCSSQGNCPADQITAVTISVQVQPPGKATSVYQTTVTPLSISYATNVG